MKSGLWFQLARGRAIVRNRCMRNARYLKQKPGVCGAIEAVTRRDEISRQVRRAREAHREWRKYRARIREDEEFARNWWAERGCNPDGSRIKQPGETK